MPSSHLILCHPLLLLPPIFPSIRIFSNESDLCIRWSNTGDSASVLSMNIQDWFTLGLTGLISLWSKGLSRVFCSTTVWKHQKALYTWLSGIYSRDTGWFDIHKSINVICTALFSHSVVSDSATPWTAAHQASLSITSSWSLLKLMSIESAMLSSSLTLCHPLFPAFNLSQH